MNLTLRLLVLTFIALALLNSVACTDQPMNSNSNTVSATPSPTASPTKTVAAAPARITLPLLDALLTDERFVAELKSNLKISDQQIDSLKQVSQSEIARLRQANAEDTDGDPGDPQARAAKQLETVLGDEKARQLASLANDFWAKGSPEERSDGAAKGPEMLPGPNAVPTDTRVVVNIPAFRMDLFQNGSLIKSYKIGIGYPQFPLPQGLRKAQTIIINPTWTPPDSPWVASMKDVTAGETVEAGSKLNPLGPIKIPIGLPSLIHGGKSPAKIGKFASHGCVGLTNAQVRDFAMLLARASGTEVSAKTIDAYLQEKTRTRTVKLNEAVPVELRYETIVLEDGKLRIYKDVYAQNTNTEENLRNVLAAHGVTFEDLPPEKQTEILNALKPVPDKKSQKKQNEIAIDIPSIAQKGYPVPVALSSGR
jgi:lipoprotein-anchoring transpeptidase ErfK/SrfK